MFIIALLLTINIYILSKSSDLRDDFKNTSLKFAMYVRVYSWGVKLLFAILS